MIDDLLTSQAQANATAFWIAMRDWGERCRRAATMGGDD